MYREYDEQTLKRLQQTELGILKDFLWLCEKYHLTYFSFAGTAIGACAIRVLFPGMTTLMSVCPGVTIRNS